ncbi:MAG: ATP-binding protein [Bdellovibrio sp.]|nr:ATP-binding protein [Bdellovibrio sp.]
MSSRLSSSIHRLCPLDFDDARALVIFGPRKTGKTTLLVKKFPQALRYDLLMSDVRATLSLNPSLLRQEVQARKPKLVILDEIQKVPSLLDEVHWLIENTESRFIICGSSPRKLKRGAANLLGGRALRTDLFPLVSAELDDLDLIKALNSGLIPQHYLSKNPDRFLKAYVEQYLQEEIIEESHIRKLQSFHRFLETAALMNGELLNYANVGADCGVSPKTVREYYQILEDSLIGFTLNPWTRVKTRELIETAKFYLFDTGVVRHLKSLPQVPDKTREFGNLFETFLIHEIRAYLSYSQSNLKLSYWRTTSDLEVDLIVGNMQLALEFKSTDRPRSNDLRGLRALGQEHSPGQMFLVCQVPQPRRLENGILCVSYKNFLQQLWAGQII